MIYEIFISYICIIRYKFINYEESGQKLVTSSEVFAVKTFYFL